MATPAQNLNFCGVFSESKRIINAHSRHFLALSVLFLLPLSFSLIIYPTLQSTLSQSNSITAQTLLFLPTNSHPRTLLLPLLYTIFITLLSTCATATITYSTYHGFYGRPVKLLSAIKSLLYSFLPLISTTIAAQIIVFIISLIFASCVLAVMKGAEILGYEIGFDSTYFVGFILVLLLVLGFLLISLQVKWALACVVVVAESKWGFEPLRRSAYLTRGMRSVSLSLLLFFGLATGFMVWVSSSWVVTMGGFSEWRSWGFIVQTVAGSSLVTLFMLQNAAAITVLYMYCKALHGELAFEIAEEFAREYLSLPFDDEKVPHVVTVVQG